MSATNAPTGWHWGVGCGGESYYTHWMYSDDTWELDRHERRRRNDGAVRYGYEIEQYWDEGQKHKVVARKSYYDEDGDIVDGERASKLETFNTERAAHIRALELAEEVFTEDD